MTNGILFQNNRFCRGHTNIITNKGGENMMNQNKNESIECTIKNCTHHAGTVNYCTLDKIHVGTHEMNPTKKECTDCDSFQYKMS